MTIDDAIRAVIDVLEDAAPNLDRHRADRALHGLVRTVLDHAQTVAGGLADDARFHTHSSADLDG